MSDEDDTEDESCYVLFLLPHSKHFYSFIYLKKSSSSSVCGGFTKVLTYVIAAVINRSAQQSLVFLSLEMNN